MKLSQMILDSMNAVNEWNASFEVKKAEIKRLHEQYQRAVEIEEEEALAWYRENFSESAAMEKSVPVENKFNKNDVILMDGHVGIVTEINGSEVVVKINKNDQVFTLSTLAENLTLVKGKKKYTKDEQRKIFGFVFSGGNISIDYIMTNDQNAFGLPKGEALKVRTSTRAFGLTLV